jgi:hypothetical protein
MFRLAAVHGVSCVYFERKRNKKKGLLLNCCSVIYSVFNLNCMISCVNFSLKLSLVCCFSTLLIHCMVLNCGYMGRSKDPFRRQMCRVGDKI